MKALIFFICISAIFFSCKKEKKDPAPFQATNQDISTDSINGEFTVKKIYNLNNDSLVFEQFKAFAQFYQSKKYKYSATYPPNMNVGNVVLNGVQFYVQPSPYNTYIDSTSANFTAPYSWQISGNGTYPGFNFNDNTNFPISSYANSFPDTIIIDQQNTINFGSYSGSWVQINIQSLAAVLTKFVEYPSNQIVIQPNEIYYSGLGNEDGWIFVEINNSYYKPINGKMYRFNSTITFYKSVILKHS